MKTLECTKCGEEAYTYAEFISGKCRRCGDELEEEAGDTSTASEMGMDSDIDMGENCIGETSNRLSLPPDGFER